MIVIRHRCPKRSKNVFSQSLKGILFITPWIIGFLAFQLYPLLSSLYHSFTVYDVLRAPVFVGLANYRELFQDRFFVNSLKNTLYFTALAVPGRIVAGFALALLLNLNLRLRSLLRTIFFLPSIVPLYAAAIVWMWLYNYQYGLMNGWLQAMGLRPVPWLASPERSKASLAIMSVWACGNTMIIFLAALQDVPRELYEAARLDGASSLHEVWYITIPMVTPAILFNLLIGLIGTLQTFARPWIMTGGGPARSTEFLGMYLYKTAFEGFRMGYASAVAWVLFAATVVIAVLIFRTSARWVYYGGERR